MRRIESDAPGIVERKNRRGGSAWYWQASRASRNCGDYQPRTVRLHYDTHEERAAACLRHTAEMLEAIGGNDKPRYEPTIKGLLNTFQTDEFSTYHDTKYNTQRFYDENIRLLIKAGGERRLSQLTGRDFKKLHTQLARPKEPGAPERSSRAHHAITALRTAVRWGAAMDLPYCARVATMLSAMRFKLPKARKQRATWAHINAFRQKAHEMGRPSMALATVLQFELTMRQKDVIGEWFPDADPGDGGIVHHRKRWSNGLMWGEHISADMILEKVTTKRGEIVVHDLKSYPAAMEELALIPDQHRIGPLIVSETSGRPYLKRNFAEVWRKIARAAGIPDDVWNMDARAGGITEGSDAGAELETLRHAAGNADAASTRRYNRRTVDKSRAVAKLRLAHRNEE